MIVNSILNQFIIPEYYMGVNHKGDSNANDINSIFDVSHDYVKKVVPERKHCFSSKCHISDIYILPAKEKYLLLGTGSNYLLISRDFKNCMVFRAIYFKVFALANR